MNNGTENNSNFKEAIIKVVAFFDMFDYVLTDVEIWRMLDIKCRLNQVIEALENFVLEKKQIENKNGFYFLAGRGAIIEERLGRYNFTDRKFKRAVLISKIFKFIPWIKMIAVGNLLGAHNLKDSSDIDFFIVTEDKKIWLTRFFCAGLTKFLGLRPQADNSRDKICLSFYVSEKAMELSSLRLNVSSDAALKGFLSDARNDNAKDDIYFIHWLAGLTPLYDVDNTYRKLIKANQWLYNSLPNWQPLEPAGRRKIKPFLLGFYHEIINLLIGGLEPQFRKLQLKLLPPQLKNLMNQDSRVVINDQIIKLHANDRREEYRNKYFNKMRDLIE